MIYINFQNDVQNDIWIFLGTSYIWGCLFLINVIKLKLDFLALSVEKNLRFSKSMTSAQKLQKKPYVGNRYTVISLKTYGVPAHDYCPLLLCFYIQNQLQNVLTLNKKYQGPQYIVNLRGWDTDGISPSLILLPKCVCPELPMWIQTIEKSNWTSSMNLESPICIKKINTHIVIKC